MTSRVARRNAGLMRLPNAGTGHKSQLSEITMFRFNKHSGSVQVLVWHFLYGSDGLIYVDVADWEFLLD